MSFDLRTLTPEYKEIYDRCIMEVDTNIRLRDVILSPENKEKIDLFMKEMKYRDTFYAYGLEPMNRILMYGASGTGKTFSSKALCNELGYTMLYVDIAKALSDDTVSKNISDIFKLANHITHCVIMFDECDAIAWQRDTGNSDTGTIRRAANSIFQSLDQMDHSNVFISATNMLHRLDPAFERRFNMKMEFTRPKLNLKEASKHFLHKGFTFIDDVDSTTNTIVDRRAASNVKLSYYEIQGLVERAMKDAILNNNREVHSSRIYEDLAKVMGIKRRFQTDIENLEDNQPPEDRHNN